MKLETKVGLKYIPITFQSCDQWMNHHDKKEEEKEEKKKKKKKKEEEKEEKKRNMPTLCILQKMCSIRAPREKRMIHRGQFPRFRRPYRIRPLM